VHGSSLNFEQGFGQFEAIEKTKKRADSRAEEVNDSCFEWLDAHKGEPFFLYLHTIDPHAPYDPPEATKGTWSKGYDGWIEPHKTGARQLTKNSPLDPADLQQVLDLYDEEILNNDRQFAVLCDRLKELGLWDDTIVVVVSDHGEEFYDHEGFGHGTWLWNELLHVPLLVKPDKRDGDQLGRRVADRVRIMDVMPTILSRMGIRDSAARAMGVDLGAFFTGGELTGDLPIIAEEYPDKVTLTTGKWKWIRFGPRSRKDHKTQTWLFDLEADRFEQNDLSDERPEITAQMRKTWERLLADYEQQGFVHMKGVSEHLSEEDKAKLQKIGYGFGADDADAPAEPEHDDANPEDGKDDVKVEDPAKSGGR
jgi:arylsulfatase A-like enzyme